MWFMCLCMSCINTVAGIHQDRKINSCKKRLNQYGRKNINQERGNPDIPSATHMEGFFHSKNHVYCICSFVFTCRGSGLFFWLACFMDNHILYSAGNPGRICNKETEEKKIYNGRQCRNHGTFT